MEIRSGKVVWVRALGSSLPVLATQKLIGLNVLNQKRANTKTSHLTCVTCCWFTVYDFWMKNNPRAGLAEIHTGVHFCTTEVQPQVW